MNWAAVAAVISAITLLVLLLGGAVLWGKITERVDGLVLRANSHKQEIAAVTLRTNEHDVRIGKLEEWKSGFNAAARIGGHTPEMN
jgi:hypothetical protein